MADDSTTPETPEGDEGKPETPDEQVVAQADKPDAVQNLIDRERDARKAEKQRADELAAKVKEYEDASKSEQEKLAEERDQLKREAEQAKADALRVRVALEKKLPADLIDRLRGNDEDELREDADKLLSLVKPADATDFDSGARTPAPEKKAPDQEHNAWLAGRLGAQSTD